MSDLIISIPGQVFLIIFSLYALAVIFIAKIIAKRDYTHTLEAPEPTHISPLDTALLKGGYKGAINVAIFYLWNSKHISIENNKNIVTLKKENSHLSNGDKLEKYILNKLSSPKSHSYFFSKEIIPEIKTLLAQNDEKLKEQQLLADIKVKTHIWKTFTWALLFLIGFGGVKLYYGLSLNKPSTFLIILLILSVIALYFTLRPSKVFLSNRGRRFLKSTTTRFEYIKQPIQRQNSLDDSVLYGVALFGVYPFMDTMIGKSLDNPPFLNSNSGGCSVSSGCSSSGCSSSGCSSSGCGSSGCGGCGGGD